MSESTISYVTGTDTDVGKTITTAALAAALTADGDTVAVYKPTQTGVSCEEPGDMAEVARLSGVKNVYEGIRLRDPMAPDAAALRENRDLPSLADHAARILELAASHDHVLVEGAGGLLVTLDGQGNTIAELAALVDQRVVERAAAQGSDALTIRTAFVVVCRSALGTLNHTGLTLEALHHRGVAAPALVIGAWPAAPSYVEVSNLDSLQGQGVNFLGTLPAGAAQLAPETFRAQASEWLKLPNWS